MGEQDTPFRKDGQKRPEREGSRSCKILGDNSVLGRRKCKNPKDGTNLQCLRKNKGDCNRMHGKDRMGRGGWSQAGLMCTWLCREGVWMGFEVGSMAG